MQHFKYKKQTRWAGFHLVGIVLISAALIIWITSYFVGDETDPFTLYAIVGISLSLGMLSLSTYSGMLIDFQTNRFKEYQSILWLKIGEWQELPKIEYAELIHHSFRKINTRNGITPTFSQDVTVYKCVLIAKGTKFLAFDYAKEKDAIVALEEIKKGLGI